MKRNLRLFTVFVMCALLPLQTNVYAADTAIASFNISGTVPVYFSVTTRGVPGDLDLSPKVIVNNRRIGLLHFKYNTNVASLTIASSTASGGPEGASGAYNFQGGFKVSVGAGCTSVDATYNSPFALTNSGTDVKSATSAALTSGIEEDCDLLASWKGTSQALPLSGVYGLNLTVTMISQ